MANKQAVSIVMERCIKNIEFRTIYLFASYSREGDFVGFQTLRNIINKYFRILIDVLGVYGFETISCIPKKYIRLNSFGIRLLS